MAILGCRSTKLSRDSRVHFCGYPRKLVTSFRIEWQCEEIDYTLSHNYASLLSKTSVCTKPWLTLIWLRVHFNSASSSKQWGVSLLQWLTMLSVLYVSHLYAIMNNKTTSCLTEDVLKTDLWLGAYKVCASNQIRESI